VSVEPADPQTEAFERPVVARGLLAKLRWGVADALVVARRNLLRIPRSPELLVILTIQPVMFTLLFVYVFGGAIQTPGFDYVDFLLPGILVQTIAFNGSLTGVGLAEDLQKGLVDRFRSLPMARSGLLAGRTLADVATNAFTVLVMVLVGYAAGFRFASSVPEVVAGVLLLLLFGYAISWISAIIGLSLGNVEAAQSAGFIWLFPLTFVSSAFVPTDSMPGPLAAFAEVNPITLTVNALRGLFLDAPAGNAPWLSLLWCVGLVAVFAPLAVARYRRVASR
jgi:ABC-2 type transport system permease protein